MIERERESSVASAGGGNRLARGPVRLVRTPLWLGAERRGVELGADAIETGLRARPASPVAERLLPSITIPAPEPHDADSRLNRGDLTFLPEIAATCSGLADEVAAAIARGELPVALGGDHALAAGSITGAATSAERLGVLWFDSHADLNTPESSPSGHVHGMSLAAVLGVGPAALVDLGRPGPKVAPEDVCLLGTRGLDPGERALIAARGVWMLPMEEWTDAGLLPGLEAALDHLATRGVDAVHLSFDVDVLDPLELPGTGTPVIGGLTVREASRVLRRLRIADLPFVAVDWVELNPLLDPTGRSTTVAVSLLATLLGETVR
ncbi:MAG: arginase [Thermomicrobiales bacterium]